MKQVKFSGIINNKKIKGYYFCNERPTNPKIVANRIARIRYGKDTQIVSFKFFIIDIKEKMIKLQ